MSKNPDTVLSFNFDNSFAINQSPSTNANPSRVSPDESPSGDPILLFTSGTTITIDGQLLNFITSSSKAELTFRLANGDNTIYQTSSSVTFSDAIVGGAIEKSSTTGATSRDVPPYDTDSFRIEAPSSFRKHQADIITDYNPAIDKPIQIALSSFPGAVGKLKIANKTTHLAKLIKRDAPFIYDQQQGYFYYNENGKRPGFGDGGILAILEGQPKIVQGDFDFV